MNLPIQPMQIGVHSCIGYAFTVIPGPLTVGTNALRAFQKNGVLQSQATLDDAARLARGQASGLKKMGALTSAQVKFFGEAHEWICTGVENVPASLQKAYEAFQGHPMPAGAAFYFDVLAGLIDQEAKRKQGPG